MVAPTEDELLVDPGNVTALLIADSGWHHFGKGEARFGPIKYGANSLGPGVWFRSPDFGTVATRFDAIRGLAIAD